MLKIYNLCLKKLLQAQISDTTTPLEVDKFSATHNTEGVLPRPCYFEHFWAPEMLLKYQIVSNFNYYLLLLMLP